MLVLVFLLLLRRKVGEWWTVSPQLSSHPCCLWGQHVFICLCVYAYLRFPKFGPLRHYYVIACRISPYLDTYLVITRFRESQTTSRQRFSKVYRFKNMGGILPGVRLFLQMADCEVITPSCFPAGSWLTQQDHTHTFCILSLQTAEQPPQVHASE